VSVGQSIWNLGTKAIRRAAAVHKPFLRSARRRARDEEHEAFARDAAAIDRQIAAIAAGAGPSVAGPWLAEVGYEVLYWIPFVRWFADAFAVPPQRLVALSRGGMESAYAGVAGQYVDIFDVMPPSELAARNAQRQAGREGGGQKQSDVDGLDEDLAARAGARLGIRSPHILHPSLMFRLFRHAWHGSLPMDMFWRHTRYEPMDLSTAPLPDALALPPSFTVVKIYSGPALTLADEVRQTLRGIVSRVAEREPVLALATDFGLDEHRDLVLDDVPGVVSLQRHLVPRTNLGVQLAVIARSRQLISTCGGLAWLAPFLGVPTVALFDRDHLLAPHLLVARQAAKRTGAAEFATLDLRARQRLNL
jgi:hypothetical protein